jgi:hypothetical protein
VQAFRYQLLTITCQQHAKTEEFLSPLNAIVWLMALSVTSVLAAWYGVRYREVWTKIRKALHQFLILAKLLSKNSLVLPKKMYTV